MSAYSGKRRADICQSSRSQRSQREPFPSVFNCVTKLSSTSPDSSVAPTKRFARYAIPKTKITPTTSRSAVHCHPKTKPMNTTVAELKIGLPSQYASAAPTDDLPLRSPTASGAAQQVHIIEKIDATP